MSDFIFNTNLTDSVIKEACENGLKQASFFIEGEAKKQCPVDTGRLRASISTNFDDIEKLETSIGTSIEYAPYVELGSSKHSAQPYLNPALENNIESVESLIINEIKRALQ